MAAVFVLGLSVGVVPTQASAADPDAEQILKRMTDYLSSLQKFSLDTDNMLEEVLVSGQKIQYDFTSTVVIQRPNKLRSERTGDLNQQLFVYNGKNLVLYDPMHMYYAVEAAPDNLDDVLHFARDKLDIVPPVGDVVFTNAFDLLTASITSGAVVGKSVVGGVKCDHLAFTTAVVDWQIWIADGDQPLPYKYVLTTKDDPAQPQYIVLMSNWNAAPEVNDALFEFTPPPGAKETDFLHVDTATTPE
jgi:hypothetical protein